MSSLQQLPMHMNATYMLVDSILIMKCNKNSVFVFFLISKFYGFLYAISINNAMHETQTKKKRICEIACLSPRLTSHSP